MCPKRAKAVVTRLADILFIQAIRAHFNSVAGDSVGWLAGLKDAKIARALTVIHRRSAESWTVASLAKLVGMSRSAFAEKFKATVGEAPLQYVARWRLNLAARLLRTTQQAKISWVAREVGYESEVAFHRAFKRLVGVSPGDYRRKCRDQACR